MVRHRSARRSPLWLLIAFAALTPTATGQSPTGEAGWVLEQDEAGRVTVHTMAMTLHPRSEPRPAMKHRLLPSELDLLDGNAATFYLSAMGFLEQSAAQERVRQFRVDALKQGQQEGKGSEEVPPYSWLSMTPEQLPLDEVRDYLQLLSFQKRFLTEAARRRHFDLDRNVQEIDYPVGFLLPEIQELRELARNQSLRCKLAIAEERIEEAMKILGQQYTLARHLSQDVFLVPGMVGNAIVGIAWNDALQLAQHPDAPNLYWAYASLPRPLLDTRHAFAVEHDLFYLQFKPLREVDEQLHPASYWRDFVDRLILTIRGLENESGLPPLPDDPDEARGVMTALIAAAYPAAKQYLLEEWGLPADQVESYPTTQVVFLALVRAGDEIRDAHYKWVYLPSWQEQAYRRIQSSRQPVDTERLGWIAELPLGLTGNVGVLTDALSRSEQQLALLQTIEAIRMYAAENHGTLPESLDDLPVPAPIDPVSGKPFEYQSEEEQAVLSGHPMRRQQFRLVLRVVPSAS